MLYKFRTHTDSGIFNHKPIDGSPVLTGKFLYLNKYGTMGAVILERIVDDVHQNLLHVQRIADQSAMLKISFLKRQLNLTLLCLGGQKRNTVFQYIMKIKRFLHRRRSSTLLFADLKNVVDKRQQMLR